VVIGAPRPFGTKFTPTAACHGGGARVAAARAVEGGRRR
jgi:hypothetical protein